MATGSSEENPPPSKKRRISLSLKRKETTEERFPVVEEKELEEASKGVVPLNTKKNNTWAIQNFNEWALSRNSRSPDDPVPEDLLSSNDADVMCKWLCLFVMETRQKSGCPYPPSSLYSILCGLYRVCHSNGVKFYFLCGNLVHFFLNLHRIWYFSTLGFIYVFEVYKSSMT